MLKLTKKADYGLIALRHLACQAQNGSIKVTGSAKEISDRYRIPLPLLSKVLQTLVRNGLLVSEQGATGGYKLARDPHEITALEVIRSIDGPIILTQCFTEHDEPIECDQSEMLSLIHISEPTRQAEISYA